MGLIVENTTSPADHLRKSDVTVEDGESDIIDDDSDQGATA